MEKNKLGPVTGKYAGHICKYVGYTVAFIHITQTKRMTVSGGVCRI